MIVGRALETTVEDRNATNIASNIPDSAERICRWVIRPCCSTGAVSPRGMPAGAEVGTAAVRSSWVVVATVLLVWRVRAGGGAGGPRGTRGRALARDPPRGSGGRRVG